MKADLEKPNGGAARPTRIRVKRLPHARGLPMPAYQTPGAAGLDLAAALPARKPITLPPMARLMVPTGLAIELPPGFEAQVRPRSGLAVKHGITVLNSPGTIDSDYRGEVMVLLVNLGAQPFTIERGERVAQLVVQKVVQAEIVAVSGVGRTARGSGGFGSTGKSVKAAKPAARRAPRAKTGRAPVPPRSRRR